MPRVPSNRPNSLASGSVDRLSDRRKDDDWVSSRLHDADDGRVHVIWQGRLFVQGDLSSPVPYESVRDLQGVHHPVLLGDLDGALHFVLDLSHVDQHKIAERMHEDAMITGLREASGRLNTDHANLLAFASGITTWHTRSRFCGMCGAETEVREAGHMRKCPSCAAEHFPRTDPAVIMLVVDGDRCIMGRQKVWPAGFFSTLAGFVEPGESLEDAVTREVREEVGVEIVDVTYHSSQPWPFPQSIMLGFHATYAGGELAANVTELEEARWFSAEELRDGFPKVPPSTAISGRLIGDWLASL